MRIGDKVRFLNDVGGGKVAGFNGNNIVLVEDEDGFQIPVSIHDVVLEQGEDYSITKVIDQKKDKSGNPLQNQPQSRSLSAMLHEGQEETVDMTVEDMVDIAKPVTFRQKPQERKGGNLLSAYLAFVPSDSGTPDQPRFEMFLINDCNYFIRFVCATADDGLWTVKWDNEVEPNAKTSLGEVGIDDLNAMTKVNVQLLAYKREQPFMLKPTVDTTVRIEPVRFFKANSFRVDPFFDEPALLFTIIEADKLPRPGNIDAKQLQQAMQKDESQVKPQGQQATSAQREQLVRRYADDQSKGNKKSSPYIRHRELDDTMVIDLHAEQILDFTRGMKPGEILNYQLKVFIDTLAQYADKPGQKLVFIHGKGEGVLRKAIINELRYKYKNYTFQDASFQEYGYGATMVTIK
ncbi:MAG: DUF2027 domain-containing protein [Prevotella sp.]|nr:DUF2027 domain-containing protein [Prevotella sp.]